MKLLPHLNLGPPVISGVHRHTEEKRSPAIADLYLEASQESAPADQVTGTVGQKGEVAAKAMIGIGLGMVAQAAGGAGVVAGGAEADQKAGIDTVDHLVGIEIVIEKRRRRIDSRLDPHCSVTGQLLFLALPRNTIVY